MHKLGIMHNDLNFDHITLMDDLVSIRIIGFTSPTTGHECHCMMSDVELWGIPKPPKDKIGCSEIYDVCELVNVFVPGA